VDVSGQPILRAVVRLAPPAALACILQNAYNQLDAWFLGRVSATASNALGLFMMVQIANFGFILVLARGTQSLLGRHTGAGRRDRAEAALAQGLGLAMRVVLPLVLLQWIWAPELLAFMGGQGDVVDAAAVFLRTLFFFMPFLYLGAILDFSFQALGDTLTPFLLQCLALTVNAALNWTLVLPHEFACGGQTLQLGGLGVMGSALATGISRVLASLLALRIMVRREGFHSLLVPASFRTAPRVVREILRVGLPAGASTLLYALVGMGVLQVVGRFGQDAYGAYGIGFRGVESFSFMIVLGIGAATATVSAHATGAGDIARVRRTGHVGAATGVAVMLCFTLLFRLLPRALAGIYTDDAGILDAASLYISTMALCQMPQALEMIYGDAMAGAGSTARTMFISVTGNALRIPLAWLFAVTLGWGLQGVWYAIVASAVLKGLGVAALYVSGRWEQAMHRGRELLDAA
jgi:putative MATE family efflux protein